MKEHGDTEAQLNLELDSLEPLNSEAVYAHDTYTRIPFEGLAMWYRQRVGSFIQFPNFLSTSKSRWNGFETVYKIITSTPSVGRDISTIVNKPGEAEVLFKSKAVFVVTGVTDCIELTEVKQADNLIILYSNIFLEDEDVYRIYRQANPESEGGLSLSDLGGI